MVSTTYPADPSATLTLTWNESASIGGTDSQDSTGGGGGAGGAGLWELVWVDDPSSVAWVAVPSTGLAYPGESISVSWRRPSSPPPRAPQNLVDFFLSGRNVSRQDFVLLCGGVGGVKWAASVHEAVV